MSAEKKANFVWKSGESTQDATVQFLTLNQGAPNEHLIVIQEFAKPGTYSYTTNPINDAAVSLKPADVSSINRGLTRAAELVANIPIIRPSVHQMDMPTSQK